VIVSVCPMSMITAVGDSDTVGAASIVIPVLVDGDAVIGLGVRTPPPVVPVSDNVTVRTQLPVEVGANVCVMAAEFVNGVHVPDTTDQA